jgi:hypothetical protein
MRSGNVMRSAKMKAITPPKEMLPFHSAAASGTLPMEQTKLMMAMNGPTTTANGPCLLSRREGAADRWSE